MPTKKILSQFEEMLNRMTPEQRKLYFSPYFPSAPNPNTQVQIGAKNLSPYITTEQIPTKFVKGTELLELIRKNNDTRTSGKRVKCCWDCVNLLRDTRHTTQIQTGKQITYRCNAQVGEIIDPDTAATSPEKWFGEFRDCPYYVDTKRISRR